MKRIIAILMAAMLLLGMCSFASAEETTVLQAPTDFTFDPATGNYSFNAVDENAGYYFIRFYQAENGQISGEYISSSKRIRGGKTGEITGTIDLGDVAWGAYAVSLCTFAPAGSSFVSPDPVNIFANFGVGLPLERPEMLAMYSGSMVQFVIDWWTLDNYLFYEYLPFAKFTFYADEACTQEVFADTVDLAPLKDTLRKNPPGIEEIWGYVMNILAPLFGLTPMSISPVSVAAKKDGARSGIASVTAALVLGLSAFVWLVPFIFATTTNYDIQFNLYGHYGVVLEMLTRNSFIVVDAIMALVGLCMVGTSLKDGIAEGKEAAPFLVTIAGTFFLSSLPMGVVCGIVAHLLVSALDKERKLTLGNVLAVLVSAVLLVLTILR